MKLMEEKIMSCFVCNNETISVIVKGFELYNVELKAKNYYQSKICAIIDEYEYLETFGQALLDINVNAYDYRYGEKSEKQTFKYVDEIEKKIIKNGKIDNGLILGCIKCFEYQASELSDYFTSDIHYSFNRLKEKLLEVYIKKDGFKIPWGYDSYLD